MASDELASVSISVTTLDPGLARRLEPRAATPQRRLEAIAALASAGVPVGVLFSPVISALTDQDMEQVLKAAAGAVFADCTFVRLPGEVRDLFADRLATHAPGNAAHGTSLIRQAPGARPATQSVLTQYRQRLQCPPRIRRPARRWGVGPPDSYPATFACR
jgi:DNA repair photolyase